MINLTEQSSLEWIKSRRSTYQRQFSEEAVSRNEVEKLLEVARWAPTHKLTQPWRFVVFMDDGRKRVVDAQLEHYVQKTPPEKVLAKKLTKMKGLAECPAIVAIVMKRDELHTVPEWEEMCAVACAVQNIWTHAKSLGLAGYWSTGGGTNSAMIREMLGLSSEDRHMGWFYLGKPQTESPTPENRASVDAFTEWVTE